MDGAAPRDQSTPEVQPPSSVPPVALDVVQLYYRQHQPRYGPQANDTRICPPVSPCFCRACALARERGLLQVPPEVRRAQTLFVMQGAPGSGKSTKAWELATDYGGIICSTDTFFYRNGVYVFQRELLTEYHGRNLQRAVALLDEGWTVVVDNTNIQRWACREYVRHAVRLGVRVEFVRMTGRFRNEHGVPAEAVESMRSNMEDLTLEAVLASCTPWEAAPPATPPPPPTAPVNGSKGGPDLQKRAFQTTKGEGGGSEEQGAGGGGTGKPSEALGRQGSSVQ